MPGYQINVETVFSQRGGSDVASEFRAILAQIQSDQVSGGSSAASATSDISGVTTDVLSSLYSMAGAGKLTGDEFTSLVGQIRAMSNAALEFSKTLADSRQLALPAAGKSSATAIADEQAAAVESQRRLAATAAQRTAAQGTTNTSTSFVAGETGTTEAKNAALNTQIAQDAVNARSADRDALVKQQKLDEAAASKAELLQSKADEAAQKIVAAQQQRAEALAKAAAASEAQRTKATSAGAAPTTDPEVLEAAGTKLDSAQFNAALQTALADIHKYAEALAQTAEAQASIKAQTEEELASHGEISSSLARQKIADQQIADETQRLVNASQTPEVIQAQADLIAETKRLAEVRNSQVQKELADDAEYNEAASVSAQAKRLQAVQQKASGLGVDLNPGESAADLESTVAVAQRAESDRQVASQNADILANQHGELDAIVARKVSETELADAVKAGVVAQTEANTATAETTRFQRLQAELGSRAGQSSDASSYQTAGQFLGSKAITTAGFAASGALLYGSVSAIKDLIQNADQLQVEFTKIDAEMSHIGQGTQFGAVKQQILDIAASTGVASSEVAGVAFQFIGAFGDSKVALQNTADAMKLVQVSGLGMAQTINDVEAIAKSFDITIGQVGDTAVGLESRFGVLSGDILDFAGQIAPVAQEVGLSFQDTAAIGAAAAEATGRALSAQSEGLGRVLPQMANLEDKVVGLYSSSQIASSSVGDSIGKILQGYNTGNTGDVFKQLIIDYNTLKQTQPDVARGFADTISTALGGSRQAQVLLAAFANSGKLTQEFANNASDALKGTDRDAGALDSRFQSFQDTVANTGQRLQQAFKNLGQAVFDAGLATILKDATTAASGLLAVISGIFSILSDINGIKIPFTDAGALGTLTEFAVVALLASKAITFFAGSSVEAAASEKLLTDATLEEFAAAVAATGAKTDQVAATETLFVVNSEGVTSEEALTASEVEEAAASDLASGSKLAKTGAAATGLFGRLGTTLTSGLGFKGAFGGVTSAGESGSFASGIAGESGAAAYAGPLALFAAGALVVNNAFQDAATKIRAESTSLADSLKHASNASLDAAAAAARPGTGGFGNDLVNGFIRLSGGQTPADLITKQQNINYGAGGVTDLSQLQSSGDLGKFTSGINGGNLKYLQGLFNQNSDSKDLAFSTGLSTDDFSGDATAIDPKKLAAAIPKIVKAAQGGSATGNEITKYLQNILDQQTNFADLKAKVNAAVSGNESKKQLDALISDAGGIGAFTTASLQSAQSDYQAGITTGGQYLAELKQALDTADKEAPGDKTGAAATAVANAQKAISDYLSKQAQSGLALVKVASDASGNPDVYIAQLKQAVAGLGQYGNLDQADKNTDAATLMQELQTKFQQAADAIKDPVAKLKFLQQGFTIPTELQGNYVEQELGTNDTFTTAAANLSKTIGGNADSFTALVADEITKTHKAIKDVVDDILNTEITAVENQLQQPGESHDNRPDPTLQAKLDKLNQLKADNDKLDYGANPGELPGQTGPDPATLQQQKDAVLKANQDLQVAQINAQIAAAKGDPVKTAELQGKLAQLQEAIAVANGDRAGYVTAQSALQQSQQAAADAQEQILEAQLKYQAQADKGDPVKAAQDAVALARAQLAAAVGAAAQQEAQTNLLATEQALSQTVEDQISAQTDLAIAILNASGDTVGAAVLAAQEAQQKLSAAIAAGTSGAALEPLQAQAVTAAAAARDAGINKKIDDINFLLQMEDITTAQAIAMFQALLQIPGETEKMKEDIELKIKSLQGELSKDFQFNLPSTIDLPTLYEARRIDQSPGGYQDNRQVAINIVVTDNSQVAAVESALNSAIGAPARSGTIPPLY